VEGRGLQARFDVLVSHLPEGLDHRLAVTGGLAASIQGRGTRVAQVA